jgi:hypothetical protein
MGGRFGKCLDSPGEVSSANSLYRKQLEGKEAGRVRKYGLAKGHWDDFAEHMKETTPAAAKNPTEVLYGGSKKHSKKKHSKKRNSKKKHSKKRNSKKKHSKKRKTKKR